MHLLIQALILCIAILKGIFANPGIYFILAFPQSNDNGCTGTNNVRILITSVADSNLTVKLTFNVPVDFELPDNLEFSLKPTEKYQVNVSPSIQMPTGNIKDNKSLIIRSTQNIVVTVYSRCASNADGYLAMPVCEFGREFVTVNYHNSKNTIGASFIVVTTVEDYTKVLVRLPKFSFITFTDYDGREYTSGETIAFSLSSGEVAQIQVKDDLTGSHVMSNKPVFVLTGVNRTNVLNAKCNSHLMAVLPAIDHLSTQYVTISFPNHLKPDLYRIVAVKTNTSLAIGNDTITLQKAGDVYDFKPDLYEYYYIKSTRPILVAQMSSAAYQNGSNKMGDGSLTILTPLEGSRDLFYFSLFEISNTFITIVIDGKSVSGLRLDDQTIVTDWYPVIGQSDLVVGEVNIVQVEDVSHKIEHIHHQKFLAYLQTTEKCEASAYPLSYVNALTLNHCDVQSGDGVTNGCIDSNDEDSCCSNMPTGEIYSNLACEVPTGYGPGDSICCNEARQPYICHANKLSSLSSSESRRQYSLLTEDSKVASSTACQMKCLVHTGCWSFNYRTLTESDQGDNCQLLIGEPNGSTHEAGWKYYKTDRTTKYI